MKTPLPDENEDELLTPSEANKFGFSEERKKKIKKILLITAPILIAIIGALFFFFFVIKAPKTVEELEVKQTKAKETVHLDTNTYLDVDPITISLAGSGSKKEYLRINITIRLGTEEESAALLSKMPIIKDALITFLGSLRSTDFNSSNSTIYLKEEISKRINKIAAPIIVKEVLFQEITVN